MSDMLNSIGVDGFVGGQPHCLPEFARLALLAWVRQEMARRSPDFIIGGEADPYLKRWWAIPRERTGNVYLHQFIRSDDDQALHDHPWDSVSIILDGWYIEHLPGALPELRGPGSIVRREAADAHRVELLRHEATGVEEPVTTLFLTGPVVREWGFHCERRGWVHWRDFTAGPAGQTAGKGCAA